jgi:hypothetical protein
MCLSQDADEKTFQTEEFRTAENRFLEEVNDVQGEYKKELSALKLRINTRISEVRESYVKKLTILLKKTTQDGNLDEAIRTRDRIKAVSEMGTAIPNTEDELAAAEKTIRELSGEVAALESRTKKIDRRSKNALVGTWRWYSGVNVIVAETGKIVLADGTNYGAIQQKDDKPGTFVVFWTNTVDTLTLSIEGNLLEGKSNDGSRVWAVKLK